MVQSVNAKQSSPVVTVTDTHKITRDVKRRKIVNKTRTKDDRVVYDKRIILDDFRTVAFWIWFLRREFLRGGGGVAREDSRIRTTHK